MKKLVVSLSVLVVLYVCGTVSVMSCTDFILPFKSGNEVVISGRTMDFDPSYFNTIIFKLPKGQEYSANAPGKSGIGKGYRWTNRYGYVGLASIPKTLDPELIKKSVQNAPISDGMNTEGLSVGALWLSYTEFEKVSETDDPSLCLDAPNVVNCLLGTCANVGDVIQKLQTLRVWVEEALKGSFLMHLSIHDSSGKSIVVEYVDGERKIYSNDEIGVLTNEPTYDWQAIHYSFLFRGLTDRDNANDLYFQFVKGASGLYEPQIVDWQKEIIGSGLIGLPGDSTSPSRYTRVAVLRNMFPTEYDGYHGVQYAIQLLGKISKCEREIVMVDGKSTETTLWGLVRDHSQKILYYYSRLNHNLMAFKLDDLDFSEGGETVYTMPASEQWYIDSTSKLK